MEAARRICEKSSSSRTTRRITWPSWWSYAGCWGFGSRDGSREGCTVTLCGRVHPGRKLLRRRPESPERRLGYLAQPRLRASAHQRALEPIELDVGDRHQQQREEEAQRLAADDCDGNRRTARPADPDAERRR